MATKSDEEIRNQEKEFQAEIEGLLAKKTELEAALKSAEERIVEFEKKEAGFILIPSGVIEALLAQPGNRNVVDEIRGFWERR